MLAGGLRCRFMNAARWVVCLASLALAWAIPSRSPAAERFDTLYFSEVLADNQTGLQDEDGARSGWIELHNGSDSTVYLDGWFLTDSPTNLTKWRFPNYGVSPDKCLVVFASAKNRASNLSQLHANFRLDRQGGFLGLVNRATNLVATFTNTGLPADVSEGRVRGEPALRARFDKPTPGKPNSIHGPGFAAEVKFNRSGGTFAQAFNLELSCSTTGAVIRYSLDGRLPNAGSPAYTKPLAITNSVHVRARAYAPGLTPGPPRSEAYVRLEPDAAKFTSKLPLLLIETFGQEQPVRSRRTSAHFSFFEPVQGRTSLTNAPTLSVRTGVRVRGSTSAGMPQPGFAVDFLDEFDEGKAHSPLGLPADSDWVLYAPNGFDLVLIHNPFIHQLSRDMGCYSPRTRFVEAFIVRSTGAVEESHYAGLYVLEEKIQIGKHRVDIDVPRGTDLKPPEVTGGYLLKWDRLGPGENGLHAGGCDMVYVDPKEEVMDLPQRAPQREYLRTFFRDYARALNASDWRDPKRGYQAFFDVDAGIDYHVVETLSGNVDVMSFSTYFYKPRNGKLVFGPHWDFDRALGSTDSRDANPRNWYCGPVFGGPWWPRMFSDVDFWQRWVDRWQQLRQTHFSLASLSDLVDRLTDEVREAQPRQETRWGLHPRGGSYDGEIGLMKAWLSNRLDFVDRQLTAPPQFSPIGGWVAPGTRLTLTSRSPKAAIYYTLDGTDPRLPQGGVATNALLYREPFELTRRTRIVARAMDPNQRQVGGPPVSTPWSGSVVAGFAVLPKSGP